VVELIIMVYAANFEMKNLSLGIIDGDQSTTSQKIVNKMQASGYFKLNEYTTSSKKAIRTLEQGKTDIVIEIPADFEKDIYNGNHPRLAITVNAINSMKAGLAASYAGSILENFGKEFTNSRSQNSIPSSNELEITTSNWFNPRMDYKSLMLPGMLAILITLVGVLLSALNIVREKEAGTIEQLNVTPLKKIQFIIGKLFPFGVIGLVQLTIGLLISVFLFHLKIQGSIILLYSIVAIYLVAVLGLGFLISTISETQTQAMFVTLFFMFTFILLSGLFTPVDSMPYWAQKVNLINPTAYLVDIIRLLVLKGSTIIDIKKQVTAIVIFGICVNFMVFWRYKKVI